MQDLDLHYLCRVIGNLAGIPIRIFVDNKLDFYHSAIYLSKDPLELNRDEILRTEGKVGYFVTANFYYYGVIHFNNAKIVLGPTRQIPDTAQALRKIAFQLDVPAEDTDIFVEGMRSIARMPLESIMQILCTLNYVLNGEKLELADIVIYNSEQENIKTLLEHQHSSQFFSAPQPEEFSSSFSEHTTYIQEQQLMRLVRKGDSLALKKWIGSAPAIRCGTLAFDQLRQVKNSFIVSASLISRAAIQGGLTPEDAFSLSDMYIQKCEFLNSLQQITNLQYHMALDFTERVERLQFGGKPTQLSIAVSNYIQKHLSQPIRVEEMAQSFYMSRPYLSAKFKAETGETLTNFILKEKIEEGKRLLLYSDKSATTIASYLGFSSVGHFSQVFRRYAGHLPTEYREQFAK